MAHAHLNVLHHRQSKRLSYLFWVLFRHFNDLQLLLFHDWMEKDLPVQASSPPNSLFLGAWEHERKRRLPPKIAALAKTEDIRTFIYCFDGNVLTLFRLGRVRTFFSPEEQRETFKARFTLNWRCLVRDEPEELDEVCCYPIRED